VTTQEIMDAVEAALRRRATQVEQGKVRSTLNQEHFEAEVCDFMCREFTQRGCVCELDPAEWIPGAVDERTFDLRYLMQVAFPAGDVVLISQVAPWKYVRRML
jgi:hypothetical protein